MVEADKKYIVESTTRRWSDSNSFETIDEATNDARRQAYQEGRQYGIYTLTAVAEAPEKINDVKITTL